jgi:putative transposase
MADELRIGLQRLLRKAHVEHDADFLRESVRALSQALMEHAVEEHIGAGHPERTGQRNGYRQRSWDTRVGIVELSVPRVRDGSYFPSLLEPRRKAERALSAVVQEAYVRGLSTRKVDKLVQALGMNGISKSQVSRLCEELDEEVERFRGRPLEGFYPYVWLDATYLKARQDGQVVSTAVVIAIGLNAESGHREVLGFDVGPSEDGAFWLSFLRSLGARGLSRVRLVTSDAHQDLKGAVEAVLHGADWQRCRVHTIRTQSGFGRCQRTSRPLWWTVQRDDVAYLQVVLPNNNTLDQKLQDGLFLLEGGILEPGVDPPAEGLEVL